MLRNLNQEKFKAASSIIDHLEVTPQDLGLEKSVANDEALRLLFSRYYERLAAEHTRVQIQVNTILRLDGTTCVSKSKYLDPGGQGVQGDQEDPGQGVSGGQADAQDQAVAADREQGQRQRGREVSANKHDRTRAQGSQAGFLSQKYSRLSYYTTLIIGHSVGNN